MMKIHTAMAERYRANLKRLRAKRGLSQPALAALMGISEGYLYQLERGLRLPSLTMIETTAVALGTDVSALLKEPTT
jgi:transcriptional regulator with XRE-family HTH domain